ncbi:DNA/RNA polymerase [Tothia fuscella]|uniref:DNA/RNA polymerase n=1 Tax=Tothia fuscella TaxID=1048955 RepID=A0A9P4NVI9_9PEZI|nr:DNA/RNA polymerase [Tothia fuscella]
MASGRDASLLKRKDERIIIHFDYDCFYASVFEAANPALKALPLAVQQKQIIVTCNYEARRRGLHKLQLIKEAKRVCPDVVIVLGEDLTCFRNASKELYNSIRRYSWSSKVERLGFDEVFADVTDVINYNLKLLNTSDLSNSFFCLSQDDPTVGFAFDASKLAGQAYGRYSATPHHDEAILYQRLILGSHLAFHMRVQLEAQKGYTSSVGISTSKLLSKLVGNVHKPHSQTTLLPPYAAVGFEQSNVTTFIDDHDIGKIPNIGFKMTVKLQDYARQNLVNSDSADQDVNKTRRTVVRDLRKLPGMSNLLLEKILGGPGMPHGVGSRVWTLLHGIDDTEVGKARELPRQISIEDSFGRLDTILGVQEQLVILSLSLINRMHVDLTEEDDSDGEMAQDDDVKAVGARKRWLAHPKTLRLSTRPRAPRNADGSRERSFNRTSKSTQVPSFLYDLAESAEVLADRLTTYCLMPLFRQLHPENNGWELSLLNVAVSDLVETSGTSTGRDISKMFKNQAKHLSVWKVPDQDVPPETQLAAVPKSEDTPRTNVIEPIIKYDRTGSEDSIPLSQASQSSQWQAEWNDEDEENDEPLSSSCPFCGAAMPYFAMPAHLRFHESED